MRKGLFGLGDLENDQPVCRYYKEECTASFAENEILLKLMSVIFNEPLKQPKSFSLKDDRDQSVVSIKLVRGQGGVQPGSDIDGGGLKQPGTVQLPGGYSQLSFNFDVPKGKVASLMGVLNYLQIKYNHIQMSLQVDGGQLSEQEYDDKIKEIFRQMGIDIEKKSGITTIHDLQFFF
ncbi:MAG: hypothetical protein IMZ61_15175 [Planctomycetes bacterium]|nr:hypothetical protein [Planctomycetota bacterium]